MECDASDVVGMPFKSENSCRVGRFDVVELYGVMTRCCEISLVGRNSKSVDLLVVSPRGKM